MLVKAKWNVKDANGWHKAGEVFQTEENLGESVEVLDAPKLQPKTESEKEPEKAEEPKQEEPKVKSASRRRTSK